MDSVNYENPEYITDSMSKRNIPTTTEKYTVTPLSGRRKKNFWTPPRVL